MTLKKCVFLAFAAASVQVYAQEADVCPPVVVKPLSPLLSAAPRSALPSGSFESTPEGSGGFYQARPSFVSFRLDAASRSASPALPSHLVRFNSLEDLLAVRTPSGAGLLGLPNPDDTEANNAVSKEMELQRRVYELQEHVAYLKAQVKSLKAGQKASPERTYVFGAVPLRGLTAPTVQSVLRVKGPHADSQLNALQTGVSFLSPVDDACFLRELKATVSSGEFGD